MFYDWLEAQFSVFEFVIEENLSWWSLRWIFMQHSFNHAKNIIGGFTHKILIERYCPIGYLILNPSFSLLSEGKVAPRNHIVDHNTDWVNIGCHGWLLCVNVFRRLKVSPGRTRLVGSFGHFIGRFNQIALKLNYGVTPKQEWGIIYASELHIDNTRGLSVSSEAVRWLWIFSW